MQYFGHVGGQAVTNHRAGTVSTRDPRSWRVGKAEKECTSRNIRRLRRGVISDKMIAEVGPGASVPDEGPGEEDSDPLASR